MKEYVLKVEGMHCEGCEARIEKALQKMEKVEAVKANHQTKEVRVKTEEKELEKVLEKLSDLGFQGMMK